MEYDEGGIFEDRATQTVIFRDFNQQSFKVIDNLNNLEIITEFLHVIYDKKSFSKSGLIVKVKTDTMVHEKIWHYLEPINNLLGTARTLDNADGPIQLEDGILSRDGYTIFDDSNSFVICDNGWIEPRKPYVKDLYFFGYGRNYLLCLKDFYKLTGETPLLPKYALGNWWSRFYKYTEETYKSLITRFEDENIPFTVSVIDMDWHLVNIDAKYGSGWTGYTWNKELFPDPKSFMSWLHEHGLKVTLNVHPADGVRAHEEMYLDMAKELSVDYEMEEPIIFDVTNVEFLKAYFKYLHHKNEADGVDFWWIDWQQGNTSKIEGLDPLWMLNHFHYLDNQKNGKRALIFSRYAGIGSHRYPIGFSGDSIITWETLNFQPYFTANASNVGYGWWSHDIGGHMHGSKDDELATRWLEFGVFSPIMRLHSSGSIFNGKEPWRYNKESHEIMNQFLRLRHQMIPYLYTMNYRCSAKGEPLIQPMYYKHQEQSEAYQVKNQYYFGSELIVAPITVLIDKEIKRAGVKTWLPDGVFIDFFQGIIYYGNRWIEMYRDLSTIPVLAKAGAIIPMNSKDNETNCLSNPEDMEIRIFAGDDGFFCLYEDDGESLDYKKGSFVKTNMKLNWNIDYQFIINPARGDIALIPCTRNYKLEFIGFVDLDDVTVTYGDNQIMNGVIFEKTYNETMNMVVLTIRNVDITKELIINFGKKPILARNNKERILFEFLDNAQIEYHLKEKIFWLVKSNINNPSKIMYELNYMNINVILFRAICEIILAD